MPSPDAQSLLPQRGKAAIQLGLRANWQQFTLLVIVNAFVGGMVGLERGILPLLGQRDFGLASSKRWPISSPMSCWASTRVYAGRPRSL